MSFPAVLILHNEPDAPHTGCVESDAGILDQVRAVEEALLDMGTSFRRQSVKHTRQLSSLLEHATEPIVFNLVECLDGDCSAAAVVPSIVRAFGKACTGCSSTCLDLTLNKQWSKAILTDQGLPVPAGVAVPLGMSPESLAYPPGPLIVKPAAADASEGISRSAVVAEPGPALFAAVQRVHQQFGQTALVETMVGERELNISLLQDGQNVRVLPLAEIDFSAFPADLPRIVDYDAKWKSESFAFNNTPRIIPAPLADDVAASARQLATAAWRITGCSDYARVDMRLNGRGELFILEVNGNPDISADAGYAAALAAADISYIDFVACLLRNAMERLPRPKACADTPVTHEHTSGDLSLRTTVATDRDPILHLLHQTGFFRPSEVETAREVLDESIANAAESGYHSLTAVFGGMPVGWVCYGPIACTVGAFDIFWLGVDRNCQGRGIGRQLLAATEEDIRRRGGRLAVIETSGAALYRPTQEFYRKVGYREEARLRNFYAEADDKVVFLKDL